MPDRDMLDDEWAVEGRLAMDRAADDWNTSFGEQDEHMTIVWGFHNIDEAMRQSAKATVERVQSGLLSHPFYGDFELSLYRSNDNTLTRIDIYRLLGMKALPTERKQLLDILDCCLQWNVFPVLHNRSDGFLVALRATGDVADVHGRFLEVATGDIDQTSDRLDDALN